MTPPVVTPPPMPVAQPAPRPLSPVQGYAMALGISLAFWCLLLVVVL